MRTPAFALRISAVICALTIVACGGGLSTPEGPVVGSPGGGGPSPTPLVDVKVTVTIPLPSRGIRPNYLSYNTASLAIVLSSVDGQPVTGVNTTVMNTLPKSHDCHTQGKALQCSSTTKGSPGNDVFAVTTYSGTDATGSVLSAGDVAAKISGNNGGVGISNNLPLTLEGVIASLKLSVNPNKAKRGKAAQASVTLRAFDATGAQIVGPSYYDEPIAVAIQGDTNNAFRLHDGKRSGSTLTIRRPASGITLTYDGNKQAAPITVQASVGGPSQISKSVGFALTGRRPPPPVGTLYVLNLGTADGVSATVTEYSGKAKGNAAPERTLNLSSTLYARSIAVDAGGNLYVGYFDNQFGYSPQSGEPDPANEIAIYAAGASGNDQPTAYITADTSSSTTIFPAFMTFDAENRLVTYGATTVDGNGGDAVLTYAAGAQGSVAPAYGWDFATPYLRYGGPTGLALDSAGNFYVNGTLHTNSGSAAGLFINAAANIGNPSSIALREIPWNATDGLRAGLTTNVQVGKTGEIFIANAVSTGTGTKSICQANTNVYAGGASGSDKPLRVLSFSGMTTKDCIASHGPSLAFFPSIALYGSLLFVADDYGNAVAAFPASGQGTVKPSLQISGSATQLNAPIALVITSNT